jgi:WS/DGAT/MGAT family acyltransferase
VREAIGSVGESVIGGIGLAPPTALNVEIGPHRRFGWTRFELAAAKEVKRVLGGTINDVVLTVVAGAVGRFLEERGEEIAETPFRALVPVNVRAEAEHGAAANHVSFLLADLPIAESDPRVRFEQVKATMARLKGSRRAHGAEILDELGDRAFTGLFVQLARVTASQRHYNLLVANVPGPPMPVYLLGARLRAIYPMAPLSPNQAVAIALFSYDGGLFWGVNADWDAVPDLPDLIRALDREFEALCHAAAKAPLEEEKPAAFTDAAG